MAFIFGHDPQKMILLIYILVHCVSGAFSLTEDFSQVQIPQGLLQGKVLTSREGKTFYGFMGIPFAQNPERFEVFKLQGFIIKAYLNAN